MASCNKERSRLIAFIILPVVALSFILAASYEAAAKSMPKSHFLSWESERRPEEYRQMKSKMRGSLKRFKASRDRVAKLKKISFWNLRPYQFATPVVDGGKLYVGADKGLFYSFDANKQDKRWVFTTEGSVQGKAAVADDTVYFGDSKAFVYALDTGTGTLKWRTKLDNEVLSTPLVDGARLYVTDLSGRLYALDRSSGVEAWHTNPTDRHGGFSIRRSASPVLAGPYIIVGSSGGSLVAYTQSGSVAWVRQLGDRQSQVYDVSGTPLYVNSKLYAGAADGKLYSLDPASGKILWVAEAGAVNDLAYYDGKIYTSGGGVLYAVDANEGSIFWEQDLETPEISTPAVADHYISVISTMDKVYLIDRDNGDIVLERYVRKGSFGDPFLVDNNLYLLSNSSRLFAFTIKELPPRKRSRIDAK